MTFDANNTGHAILRILASTNKPLTCGEIARALGMPPHLVSSRLQNLKRAEKVGKFGYRTFVITSLGLMQIERASK